MLRSKSGLVPALKELYYVSEGKQISKLMSKSVLQSDV